MIDLSKYLIFENNKKTFKETSKDDHDGSITYMTESQYQVISFDDVKEEYIISAICLSVLECYLFFLRYRQTIPNY